MDPTLARKIALRDQLVTARGRLGPAEIGARARALAEHLMAEPDVRLAATVTAYVGVGREPGTGPLLAALLAAGKRVLLPVVLPDLDLDWAVHTGEDGLVAARRGLLEPVGPRLGREAVATADVVLVPGLAVDGVGARLGQGGGCYDRALSRVPIGTPTCVILNSEEVLTDLPAEPHDRPVTAVATELGVTRLR